MENAICHQVKAHVKQDNVLIKELQQINLIVTTFWLDVYFLVLLV